MSTYKISQTGIQLITSFEGLRLTAYKATPTEPYYTIGYGHYSSDIKAGQVITKEQAETYLKQDLAKFESYVNALNLNITQCQFDALTSFCYNCGPANLKSLVANRTLAQISEALLLYNKAGGKVLNGLVARRTAEKKLFDTVIEQPKPAPVANSFYLPTGVFKKGDKGQAIKEIQHALNLLHFKCGIEDGIAGSQFATAIANFQKVYLPHEVDSVYGNHVRTKMLELLK